MAVTVSDRVDIVIHNYRWWLDLAEREPKVGDLEKRLARPSPKLYSTVAEIRWTLGDLPYEATCRVRPTPPEKTSAMMRAFSWARANGLFAESWEPMASGGCWPIAPFRARRPAIGSVKAACAFHHASNAAGTSPRRAWRLKSTGLRCALGSVDKVFHRHFPPELGHIRRLRSISLRLAFRQVG
jgi:hypothetical protein